MKRLFFEDACEGVVTIEGDELAHIYSSRLRVGEEVVLINGDGIDYCGTLQEIGKKSAIVKVNRAEPNSAEIEHRLTLYIGNPKGDKLELITQKLTELGAVKIVPFQSQFVTAKSGAVNLQRLRKISIEAAKQCGGARIVEVLPCITFNQLVEQVADYDLTILPYEKETTATLFNVAIKQASGKNFALIVGSEGGFAQDEVDKLVNAGAVSVSLGNRILRCETASITASATLLNILQNKD